MNTLNTATASDAPAVLDAVAQEGIGAMDAIHRASLKTSIGETKYANVWQVTLRRHGKRNTRTFSEARWGGREAVIAMAQD